MGLGKLEKQIKILDQAINNSINWLTKSGIQNSQNRKKILSGSVNAWYDPVKKKYSFVYSEINGYFMTMMVFLYNRTGEKKFLDKGLKAAKWLISNAQEKNGGFRCLFLIDKNSSHAHKKDQIYSFDNGVIINGLVSLYKETKKKYLLKSAEKCGNWIINHCINNNHLVKPVYEIEQNKFFESDKEWSTTSGSYHTKISIGLANLYSITKKKKYLEASKKICNSSLKFQKKNGRFISFPFKGGTNAHPHCYSAEGLWVLGTYLNNKKYLKSSEQATKWIMSKQNLNGKIPRLFLINSSIYHERVDAIAQTIRLILLPNLNKDKKKLIFSERKINKLLKIMLKHQNTNTNNIKIKGSFSWGKKSDGVLLKHANSWVTFFAIQSLFFYKDYLEKKKIKFDEFNFV